MIPAKTQPPPTTQSTTREGEAPAEPGPGREPFESRAGLYLAQQKLRPPVVFNEI